MKVLNKTILAKATSLLTLYSSDTPNEDTPAETDPIEGDNSEQIEHTEVKYRSDIHRVTNMATRVIRHRNGPVKKLDDSCCRINRGKIYSGK